MLEHRRLHRLVGIEVGGRRETPYLQRNTRLLGIHRPHQDATRLVYLRIRRQPPRHVGPEQT